MTTQVESQPVTPAVEILATPVQSSVVEAALQPTPATATPPAPVEAAPAAPSSAAPVISPTTPVPSVAPVVPPEVQQYITRLEEQNRVAQDLSDTRILEDVTGKYAQQLAEQAATEYGITVEQALPFVQRIAKERGDQIYQQYNAERMRQGQIRAALEIGKQHGVDPMILINLSTPEAMRQAALQATSHNRLASENAALKAQIEALKKASVPAQSFASGVVSADGTKLTSDNIDALYLQDPDRYGAAYRTFLRTGHI